MPLVAADARMLGSSGIGTVLQQLLPRMIARWPEAEFAVLGDAQRLVPWIGDRCRVVNCVAPIYSVREQVEIPLRVPRGTDLLWVPHYNIPIAYSGRMVVTVQDVNHLAMPAYLSLTKRLYSRLVFGMVRRRADVVVTTSLFTATEFRRLVGEPRRLEVIPLGVDEAWFGDVGGARPYPRPYFVYVGNVKPHKNLTSLLAALELLPPDCRRDLVIIGRRDGFLTGDPGVEKQALGLGSQVHFTGHVDDAALRAYVAHAEALVFPSLYEGFGLPPLEAMALGCPVVVSRAASLPEVCGDAAEYFDPTRPPDIAASLCRILRSAELRDARKRLGRERALRFSWDASADQTISLFKSALASGRGNRDC